MDVLKNEILQVKRNIIYTGHISFIMLHFCGVYKPLLWNSKLKICLYYVYSTIMITIYFLFVLSLLLFFLLKAQNIDSEMETFFHFLAFITVLFKMISIFFRSKTAMESNDLFMNKICQPRDDFEFQLLLRTSHTCRLYTILYLSLMNFSTMSVILFPPSRRSNFPLPYKIWTPYNLKSRTFYFFTYFHQGLATTMGACVTSSVETFALVIILQVCAQYEILIHRLTLISQLSPEKGQESSIYKCELKIIKNFVQHHIHIFLIGEKLNELFSFIIFIQFFGSMTILSAAIYQLTKLSLTDPKSWGLIFLLATALTQIFLYCYYGEKITSKSLSIVDRIYEITLSSITNKTRRHLILIMIRASRPIQFFGYKLIIMSIKTFFQIVKLAYSTYNLLKGL